MKERISELTGAERDAESGAELMAVKCSICGDWMDVKPGHINYISHGICPRCYVEEMRKLARDT